MNSKNNFRTVLFSLIAAVIVLGAVMYFVKTGPTRNLLRYISFGLLLALVVQFVLYGLKPGLFKNKRDDMNQDR